MNEESKVVEGIGGLTEGPLGVPVKDDGVLETVGQGPGIKTYPPDVTVTPGPLPPKEIRAWMSRLHPKLPRPLEHRIPDDAEFVEMVERFCLTWTMWKQATDRIRVLGEELAAAVQEASNQRAISERATKDAVMARAQLIAGGGEPENPAVVRSPR